MVTQRNPVTNNFSIGISPLTKTPISRATKSMGPMKSRTPTPLIRQSKPDPNSKNFQMDMLKFIDAKTSQGPPGPPPKLMRLDGNPPHNRQPLGKIHQNIQNQKPQPMRMNSVKPNQQRVHPKMSTQPMSINTVNQNQQIAHPKISTQPSRMNTVNPNQQIVHPQISTQPMRMNTVNPNQQIVYPKISTQPMMMNKVNPNQQIVHPKISTQPIGMNTVSSNQQVVHPTISTQPMRMNKVKPNQQITRPRISTSPNTQKSHPQPLYRKLLAPDNFTSSILMNKECFLFCQSLRLGSYSVVPEDNLVKISSGSIAFSVPSVQDQTKMVSVSFSLSAVTNIKTFYENSVHYSSRSSNLLFLYPSQSTCQTIRSILGFSNQESFYLDSASQDRSQTGIIINLKGAVDEEVQAYLSENLANSENIDAEEANSIVINSLPKDQDLLGRKFSPQRAGKRNFSV